MNFSDYYYLLCFLHRATLPFPAREATFTSPPRLAGRPSCRTPWLTPCDGGERLCGLGSRARGKARLSVALPDEAAGLTRGERPIESQSERLLQGLELPVHGGLALAPVARPVTLPVGYPGPRRLLPHSQRARRPGLGVRGATKYSALSPLVPDRRHKCGKREKRSDPPILRALLSARIRSGVGLDPLVSTEVTPRYRLLPLPFAEPVPFPDESFDAVVLLATLEHIPDKGPVARECRRLLRPCGRVVVTVPSPRADGIVAVLRRLRLADGMSVDEHTALTHP
jgi:Methyltransferase domain